MTGEVGADFVDLLGDVAEEGRGSVDGCVVVHADVVDEGARIHGFDELADALEAFGAVVIAQTYDVPRQSLSKKGRDDVPYHAR